MAKTVNENQTAASSRNSPQENTAAAESVDVRMHI